VKLPEGGTSFGYRTFAKELAAAGLDVTPETLGNSPSELERLAAGPVIGDGGFIFALEKRGYVKAGPWTPEATVEHPEAVRQLHREFLRAGSDVMQAFTFYASEDKLTDRGNTAGKTIGSTYFNFTSRVCVWIRQG